MAARWIAAVVCALAVATNPAAPTTSVQESTICAVYAAAIHSVADSSIYVVADSTSLGVPDYTFAMMTGSGRTPDSQGVPFPDSTRSRIEQANHERTRVPPCVAQMERITVTTDSSLRALISGRNGWSDFQVQFRGARGMLVLSRPLLMSDSSTALVYVARASGLLDGDGRLILLVRDVSGRWVRRAQAFLWFS